MVRAREQRGRRRRAVARHRLGRAAAGPAHACCDKITPSITILLKVTTFLLTNLRKYHAYSPFLMMVAKREPHGQLNDRQSMRSTGETPQVS